MERGGGGGVDPNSGSGALDFSNLFFVWGGGGHSKCSLFLGLRGSHLKEIQESLSEVLRFAEALEEVCSSGAVLGSLKSPSWKHL